MEDVEYEWVLETKKCDLLKNLLKNYSLKRYAVNILENCVVLRRG